VICPNRVPNQEIRADIPAGVEIKLLDDKGSERRP